MAAAKKSKVVSYTKWGYIFLIPFFLVYTVFSLVPLISTVYYSFFEKYMAMGGLTQVGPNFVGIQNYISMLTSGELLKYTGNTLIMWVAGFIPQILVSLLLGVWFADTQIRLKGEQFFKTVIYLPNLIMASAFAMLFFTLFSDAGPVNNLLQAMGGEGVRWLTYTWSTRFLVALMNFLMWFGNTTIMLMAGIMGIDTSLFEAANVDGANSMQTFTRITMPLLKPIFIYVLITSLIGGIQMFDVPQILTNSLGSPNNTTMTLIMWLNKHLYSKNYGTSGALSVILFVVTGIQTFIMAIMMIPTQVTALGFVDLMRTFKLLDNYIPLIVPTIAAPVVYFFMKQYMEGALPLEIVEAARIDGSNEFRTFNSIVLPIMKPAIAVQAIFAFVTSWNNYFTPNLIISKDNLKTLPILIATLRGADFLKFDMGQVYMCILLSILPVVVVYIFLSRYIIQGVAVGSVKG